MPFLNISPLFILICTTYFLNHALYVESLRGGHPADADSFKSHVVIFYRENYYTVNLLCTGAIIAPTLILTAAQCFFDPLRNLKDHSYFIVVNSTDLSTTNGAHAEITHIYIPDFRIAKYFNFTINNIAIAQVGQNLFLIPDCHLHSLNIPTIYGQSFARKIAVVGGYGDHFVIVVPHSVTRQMHRVIGLSDFQLFYANVTILTDSECFWNYLPDDMLHIDHLMCGVMMTDRPGQEWGLCKNDFGAPLVYNNTIVGIAGDHTPDCNDTRRGCLYIKTSTFTFFLNQVMQHVNSGSELEDTLVYRPNHTVY